MIELRHQIPGRMRWHVPGLRRDAHLAAHAATTLKAKPGVRQVRVNPACASLVIDFDPSAMTGAQVERQLRCLLSQEDAASPSTRPDNPAPTRHSELAPAPSAGRKKLARPGHRWGLLEMLGVRPAVQPPDEPSLLCRVNLRVTRWMLRTSFRAWWHEQVPNTGSDGRDVPAPVPSLSLVWAYQLSQPLLNSPPSTNPPARTLSQALSSLWRRSDNDAPRLLDV